MHKKIIKFALVLLATASSIFATTKAEIIKSNWNTRMTMENTDINEIQVREQPVTAWQKNWYTVTYKWNANRTITDDWTFNNIMKITNTYNAYWSWFFWNVDNEIIFSMWWNDNWFNWNAVKPLKVLKSTPSEYMSQIKTNTLYTHDISELYTNNWNVTELSFWVNSDRDEYLFISSREYRYMCITFDNKDTYCVSCAFEQNNTNCYWWQTEYLPSNTIYSYTYTDYEQYIGTSPFNSSWWWNWWWNSTDITQYSCPTIQQLINTYGDQYNTWLCYSSTLIYTGGTIQTIEPKTIFELYPTYTWFTQAINLYYNYCTAPATQETCNNAFEWNELWRTIINKLPNDAKNSSVYQYCNLQLNYEDKNATTCTLWQTWILAPWITINDIVNEIWNQDITVVTPWTPPEWEEWNGSWSVFDNLIWENTEDTERRNIIENAKNIVQTMKELYAKFTAIFRWRSWTEWFIPEYITWMLLLIILYKLFKK